MHLESIEVNGHLFCEALALEGVFERLRGLLGASRSSPPVRLVRCRSIHTFGMRFPIDVAFVDASAHVCVGERDVGAGRVLSCASAVWVLERPSDKSLPWPVVGDVVRVALEGHGREAPPQCGADSERSA